MKCPFRINEVHDVSVSDVTKVNMEYAECYGNECPYWGNLDYSPYGSIDGCRRAEKEVV